MSNLLQTSTLNAKSGRPEATIEETPGFYRTILLDALAVISALSLGFLYYLFISGEPLPLFETPPSWITILTILSIFLLSSLFETLLIDNLLRRGFLLALQVFSLSIFLFDESYRWLAVVLISMVIFFWASWRARFEMKNALSIRFYRVASVYFSKIFIALALMGTIFYFPYWQKQESIIPDQTLESAVDWTAGFIGSFYAGVEVNSQSEVDKLVDELSAISLETNPNLQALPEAQKEVLREQAGGQIKEQLRSLLGLEEIGGEEKIAEALRRSLTANVRNLETRFQDWFFFGWLLVSLFILLGVGRVYGAVLGLLAFLVYELLLAVKFLKVYVEPHNKELLDF